MNIKSSLTKPSKERVIETIFKREDTQVNTIQLSEEGTIKKHQSLKPALLLVLKGTIEFHYAEEMFLLKKWDFHHIRAGEDHWITATEESTLLLVK